MEDAKTIIGVHDDIYASPPLEDVVRLEIVPGAQIGGRYQIERLLGAGGMGRVWLADDLLERRKVAFKEMQIAPGSTAVQAEMSVLLFRREFFAMKKLQHPGTVKVFDCGILETGHRYITMEVVGGEDLSERLKQRPLGSDEVCRILAELAQILAFVHARLFVHCDIKAANVRLLEDGSVKLMDFGIMHQLGTPSTGWVQGTPTYMAPEWQRGGAIDGRTDLYSLGVLAFYMLTGEPPFRGHTEAVLKAHQQERPPKPSSLLDVDPKLEAILLRLLEKDPADRFADAAELALALSEARGEAPLEEPLAARASYLHVPVVVGRERELSHLENSLRAAQAGRSRALFIGAPAGVGKSRLLQELELDVRYADVPFALGQCRAEGLAPLAPLQQALQAIFRLTPEPLIEELRPTLGRSFPMFGDVMASEVTNTPRDPTKEKIAVFEALSSWVRRLAQLMPFVLCLEDLQWADNATLEHLNVIIRALSGTMGLVVTAFRSDELSRLSLGFQTVDEGLTDYMELAPLSSIHLTKLVELALPGFSVPNAFVQRLHEATRGNAFFATECLRAFIEQDALRRVGGKWFAADDLTTRALPRSIRDVVLARLSALTSEQKGFFERLAPAGRVLDMPLIRAIADLSEQELFAFLDEGVERQFLQYAQGRYFFVHDTVHEAIYDSTPDDVRKSHHGRIAEFLQRRFRQSPEAARSIGYHFARSGHATRAIAPLLRASEYSLKNKALFEAFVLMKEAARLLEEHEHVEGRTELLVSTWGKLIEVAYNSDTPACFHYAEKLFRHWEESGALIEGRVLLSAQFAKVEAARDAEERRALMRPLVREIALHGGMPAMDLFLKRAEYRILQSIALAIMGRTAQFQAVKDEAALEQPSFSPYRAGAHIAIGGLASHTGRFQGVVEAMREHLAVLREHREHGSRRLSWSLGMGAYFMNMVLALMGRALDEQATADGLEVADKNGFTDLRIYHLFSKIVRASFTGDGAAYAPDFAEMTDLIRRLGNPRLPDRNLAIYTPPYYLERQEIELATAAVQKGEHMAKLLPGDRWLQMYVAVYRACLSVLTQKPDAAAALEFALETTRAGDLRMETFVLVYRSRFEHERREVAKARKTAEEALYRATTPVMANPFDEILARRALADTLDDDEKVEQLERALLLAEESGNVLQKGIVHFSLARARRHGELRPELSHLDCAEASFLAARATEWSKQVASLRAGNDAVPG
jgi:eukaryotic-like serine/threonine-protein kinase